VPDLVNKESDRTIENHELRKWVPNVEWIMCMLLLTCLCNFFGLGQWGEPSSRKPFSVTHFHKHVTDFTITRKKLTLEDNIYYTKQNTKEKIMFCKLEMLIMLWIKCLELGSIRDIPVVVFGNDDIMIILCLWERIDSTDPHSYFIFIFQNCFSNIKKLTGGNDQIIPSGS